MLFLVALASLMGTLALSWFYLERVSDLARRESVHHRFIGKLDQLSDAVMSAELGQRGYLLTGARQSHLDTYLVGIRDAHTLLDDVDDLAQAGALAPIEPAHVGPLRQVVFDKLDDLARLVRVFEDEGGREALAVVEAGSGLQLARAVQQERMLLRRTVEQNIAGLVAASERARRAAATSTVASTFLSLLFLAMAAMAAQQQLASRMSANARAAMHASRLSALADLGLRLSTKHDAEQLLDLIVNEARALFQCEVAAVVVHAPARSAVATSASAAALHDWDPLTQPLSLGDHALGATLGHGIEVLGDVEQAGPRHLRSPSDVRYGASVPLERGKGVSLGYLLLIHPRNGGFDAYDLLAMAQLANLAAAAFANAVLLNDAARTAEEREHFIQLLGHELRTPLSVIQMAGEVVQRQGQEGDALQMLRRQTSVMRRVIDDLMDLARLDRGLVDLRLSEVDVTTLIRQVVADLRAARDLDDEALQFSAKDGVVVQGDRDRLVQAVSNLVDNALKFGEGKPVTVRVGSDERGAVIEVQDQGVGLGKAEQRAMFDRYAQGENRTAGLGLGLALVKRLAQMHGGSIAVHSEGLGHGATFVFRVPWEAAPPTPSLIGSVHG